MTWPLIDVPNFIVWNPKECVIAGSQGSKSFPQSTLKPRDKVIPGGHVQANISTTTINKGLGSLSHAGTLGLAFGEQGKSALRLDRRTVDIWIGWMISILSDWNMVNLSEDKHF